MPTRVQIANSVGLDTNWFLQLCNELRLEADYVRNLMKDYVASNRGNKDLMRFYPTERGIEKFGSGPGYPQNKTIDFILSFLEKCDERAIIKVDYETLTFYRFGIEIISLAQGRHVLAVTRALDAENFRRKSYWDAKNEFIDNKICGTYFVMRPSITNRGNIKNGRGYGEILHIKRNKHFQQVLNAYWRRWTQDRKIFYIGNMFISDNFLYGTFVNKSTNEIIKPVNINITIGPSKYESVRKMLLTGFLSGTSYNQDSILAYPISLRRLKVDEIPDHLRYYGIEKITSDIFVEYADRCMEKSDDSLFTEESLDYMIRQVSTHKDIIMASEIFNMETE